MIYNKANLAVAHAAAKTSIRPALANVRFEPNATVATDSYMLIKVSGIEDNAKEIQYVQLPAKNIKKAFNKNLVVFNQEMAIGCNPGAAVIETEENPDSCFPNYDQIMPTKSTFNITLSAELISRMVAAFKEFNGGFHGTNALKLSFNGENEAVLFTSENNNTTGQSFTGLVMPIRS